MVTTLDIHFVLCSSPPCPFQRGYERFSQALFASASTAQVVVAASQVKKARTQLAPCAGKASRDTRRKRLHADNENCETVAGKLHSRLQVV